MIIIAPELISGSSNGHRISEAVSSGAVQDLGELRMGIPKEGLDIGSCRLETRDPGRKPLVVVQDHGALSRVASTHLGDIESPGHEPKGVKAYPRGAIDRGYAHKEEVSGAHIVQTRDLIEVGVHQAFGETTIRMSRQKERPQDH